MSTSYNFPQQVRARDAIRELNYYFEFEGNVPKEPLPSMSKIVDYCVLHPRLLRIRDSPLRFLHDPNLPFVVVHDWYIGIALDYLEASFYLLFLKWDTEYRKKRNDKQQIAQLFSELVNNVYRCYEDINLALALPFPEGSALESTELKEKVKIASIALIKEKIPTSFNDARSTFYTLAFEQIESLYRAKQKSGDHSFAYLFSSKITKHKDSKLEAQAQMIIDTDLPKLIDIFNLSDQMLEKITTNCPSNDEDHSLETDTWLQDRDKDLEENYQIDTLESDIQNFSSICEKLNNLELAPNWTDNLKEIINRRLRLSGWEDNFEISLVKIQLKWLHVLILPWISHILPGTEDIDKNWNNFLREKIKAEYVLYDMIYHLRISNIFDIIREYPSTKNAISDFHIAATKRGLLQDLKNKLMDELKGRLLHQGALAIDVLQQYIGCINCLSIIDPTCDIMVPIIELFENYMRVYRNDCVQGAVELVRDYLDEENSSGPEEYLYVFQRSEINKEEASRDTVIVEEDKTAQLNSLQKKSKDPIAMLISICSSVSDFIDGYSDKLGEVLLSSKNYDIDVEVRKLEILKQHFPPDAFIRCDIMLKDVDDSRRLDRFIHEQPGVDPKMHSIIMSGKYWPGGQADSDDEDEEEESNDTELLKWMKNEISIEGYEEEFRKTKASRKLSFMPTKGSVTINLEFKSRTLKLDVRPEALPIISMFETKENSFTREEIVNHVKFDKFTVVECLEFWIQKEVLQLSANGYYQLVED